MSLVLLALLVAFAAAIMLVLADSGLRLWSALGGIKAQRAAIARDQADVPQPRMRPAARMTTRVSYARTSSIAGFARAEPRRAAA